LKGGQSRHDVDVGEGGSRDASPHRSSRAAAFRDFPRDHMNISMGIEDEEEESQVESSEENDVEDETYHISLRIARRTTYEGSNDNDVEG
jgi:hypothetical protein